MLSIIQPLNLFIDIADIYAITAVFKVETDIISSIPTSLLGRAVIIYVHTFKTGVIVFIGKANIIMYLTSQTGR